MNPESYHGMLRDIYFTKIPQRQLYLIGIITDHPSPFNRLYIFCNKTLLLEIAIYVKFRRQNSI